MILLWAYARLCAKGRRNRFRASGACWERWARAAHLPLAAIIACLHSFFAAAGCKTWSRARRSRGAPCTRAAPTSSSRSQRLPFPHIFLQAFAIEKAIPELLPTTISFCTGRSSPALQHGFAFLLRSARMSTRCYCSYASYYTWRASSFPSHVANFFLDAISLSLMCMQVLQLRRCRSLLPQARIRLLHYSMIRKLAPECGCQLEAMAISNELAIRSQFLQRVCHHFLVVGSQRRAVKFVDVLLDGIGARALACLQLHDGVVDEMGIRLVELRPVLLRLLVIVMLQITSSIPTIRHTILVHIHAAALAWCGIQLLRACSSTRLHS